MEDEKVQQLANTLKSQGLAASMSEAIEKAKSILNIDTTKNDVADEKSQHKENQDYDITKEKVTLNELMKEVNVDPEEVAAQEEEKIHEAQEKIFKIKKEIKEAEKHPEKMEHVKEEIAEVKEETDKIEEESKESKQEPENDRFKEEKKVDLTKVFGSKN